MLSQIFVDLECFQDVGQNFVINLSAFLDVFFFVVFTSTLVAINFPRIPPTVLEADAKTWSGADGEQKMMDEICGDVFRFVVLRNCAIIEFRNLYQE